MEEAGIENPFSPRARICARCCPRVRQLTCAAYVIANPDRIGDTVQFRLLASSRVDGYLKGRVTRESLARDKNLTPGASGCRWTS